MKRNFLFLVLGIIGVLNIYAQNGTVKGIITEEQNGEKVSLPFANVFLEGTTFGATSDFDGNFSFLAPEGTYIVMCSFMGYETFKQEITVTQGGIVTVMVGMKLDGVEIEGVVVTAKVNRETEMALMMEQKKATVIKESIGANQLSALGVSDAAAATTKISGVNKNEGSGNVYVRGLGDRYLSTTMNGMPIPSDDIDKKNINLDLFGTDVIKNVGITKTYSVESYADQTSGGIDVVSKTSVDGISVGLSTGAYSNVFGQFDNFKATQNKNDLTMGMYKRSYSTRDAVEKQSWNTTNISVPLKYGVSVAGGKKYELGDNEFSVFATFSHDGKSNYYEGIYKKYRMNEPDKSFTDATNYRNEVNTTGLLSLTYDINYKHEISYNALAIFKTVDELYEAGRNGEGYVRDQDPMEDNAFVRDQNTKVTRLIVNQLLGSHELGLSNTVKWGTAFNIVNADEPNRIRNEVNTMPDDSVQFAHVSNFQQRKSKQEILDRELNAFIKDEYKIIDEEENELKLNFGGNYRSKSRDFSSYFIGVRAKGEKVESFDNMDEAFLDESRYVSGRLEVDDNRKPDTYTGYLGIYGGFLDMNFNFNTISGSIGARYEMDEMDVKWNVGNWVGRDGSVNKIYNNVLPSANLKYSLTDKNALRLAVSKTITLPEFKEIAPFEYQNPEGDVIKGNPDLISSTNYNFDLKWEIFPKPKHLFSITGFYKQINDPITLALTSGSSGYFKYENTGEQATVFGTELEARFGIVNANATDLPGLKVSFNATKMWFNQDLKEKFQYNNKTETGLQGASDLIINAALIFSDNKENELTATVAGNYTSDKIFALGAPEDLDYSATFFNSDIIEKGFVTLDLIVSKKFSNKISAKVYGKNLLNPEIQRTQEVYPTSGINSNEVVRSYKKGVELGLGLTIKL